jgi:inosine/xanthosine triphosphatase
MKIKIGTKNKAKLEAVKEIIKDYPHLVNSEVFMVSVPSGVSDQPKSFEETINGAINRAKNVFKDCDYGIGLESGWMSVPMTKSGYMDVCVCAIYDGRECHLGLSSAWEFPNPEVTNSIIKGGLNTSEALHKAGMTNNDNIGSEEGAVGILTKGRMTRKEYSKQALRTALIHLDTFDF